MEIKKDTFEQIIYLILAVASLGVIPLLRITITQAIRCAFKDQ